MKLHDFFRSAASQRVRIALNLKGLTATQVSHHLPKGEHKSASYVALNPQGLVPTLEGDAELTFEPGTQPGDVRVLRGRGLPVLQGFGRGNQPVRKGKKSVAAHHAALERQAGLARLPHGDPAGVHATHLPRPNAQGAIDGDVNDGV